SILLAIVLFGLLGMTATPPRDVASVNAILEGIAGSFHIGWYLMIPVALVLGMVVMRVPAFPALLIGALLGCVFAVMFQPEATVAYAASPEMSRGAALVKGAWMSLCDGFRLQSGNAALDELLSRGGMSSMLSTVWLILAAMMFGAVMETTGMLQQIAASILGAVRGTGSLIAATLATSFGTNIIASDQYIAIVLPGRMFRAEYAKRR